MSRTGLSDFTFFLSIVPFEEGNGNQFQCSCLENPMDGGAWWATVHGVAKSQTGLSDFTFTFTFVLIYFIYSDVYLMPFYNLKFPFC